MSIFKDITVTVKKENERKFMENYYMGWQLESKLMHVDEKEIPEIEFFNCFKLHEKDEVFEKILELEKMIFSLSINCNEEDLYFEHKISYEPVSLW